MPLAICDYSLRIQYAEEHTAESGYEFALRGIDTKPRSAETITIYLRNNHLTRISIFDTAKCA